MRHRLAGSFLETSFLLTSWYLEELEDLGDDDDQLLEDLEDDDMALGPHFEVKTCDRFGLKTIISLMMSQVFTSISVVLVRCRRLQDLLMHDNQ